MTSPLDLILRRLESKSTEERVLALSLLPKAFPPPTADPTPNADSQAQSHHALSESDFCQVWDVIQRKNASFMKKLLRSSKETFQGAAVQVLSALSSVEQIAQSKGMLTLFPLLCTLLASETRRLIEECRLDVVEMEEGYVESLFGTITAIVRSASRSIPLDCLREVFVEALNAPVLTKIHRSLPFYAHLEESDAKYDGIIEEFKKSIVVQIRIRSLRLLYHAVKSDVHRPAMREMAADVIEWTLGRATRTFDERQDRLRKEEKTKKDVEVQSKECGRWLFEVECEWMLRIWIHGVAVFAGNHDFPTKVRKVTFSILGSDLQKSDFIRDLCVLLAHHCLSSFGPSWFDHDSKFFLLLCLKLGFEIKGMIAGKEVKECDWKPSDRMEKVFPFYIRTVESILLQLINFDDSNPWMSFDALGRSHGALRLPVEAIVLYIRDSGKLAYSEDRHVILRESVRLLALWISENPSELESEMDEMLPVFFHCVEHPDVFSDVMGVSLCAIVTICMRNEEALKRHVTSKRVHFLLGIVDKIACDDGIARGLSKTEAAAVLSFACRTLMQYFCVHFIEGQDVECDWAEMNEDANDALSMCFRVLRTCSGKSMDEGLAQWISLHSIGIILSIWRMPNAVWSEEWKEPLTMMIRTMHVVGEKLSNPIQEVASSDSHIDRTIMIDLWKESLEGIFDLWSSWESFQWIDIPIFRSILAQIEEVRQSFEAEMEDI